jgi:HD-like signal output (HDOD) protein
MMPGPQLQGKNNVCSLLETRVRRIKGYLPAMVVNILRVANLAFYGLPNRVLTVGHALTMLGKDGVLSLCIVWIASKALQPHPGQRQINQPFLWRHSIAAGVFARILAKEFGLAATAGFYLAGLMHDVGKILLDRFFHAQYEESLQLTFQHNVPLREAELQVIGESHDSVGRWLLDEWGLPVLYGDVAGRQHSVLCGPDENRITVALISLADQMAGLAGFGFGTYETTIALDETEAFSVLAAQAPDTIPADLTDCMTDLDEITRNIEELQAVM